MFHYLVLCITSINLNGSLNRTDLTDTGTVPRTRFERVSKTLFIFAFESSAFVRINFIRFAWRILTGDPERAL